MVEVLADGFRLSSTAGALIFPLAGVLLLIVGIRRRLAYDKWNRADDERLLRHGSHDDSTSQPRGRGTGFLIAAALLLFLGAGHIMAAVAQLGSQST